MLDLTSYVDEKPVEGKPPANQIPNIRGVNFFFLIFLYVLKKKKKGGGGGRGRVLTVKNKVNESNDQDDDDLHLMLKATRVPYKYPTLSLYSLTPL